MYKLFSLFVLLALPFISACNKDIADVPDEGIWIRFVNNTDEDVLDAVLQRSPLSDVRIGTIKAGQSTDYVYFNSFTISYESDNQKQQYPGASVVGTSGGQKHVFSSGIFCGVGLERKELAEGGYVLHLKKKTSQSYTYYVLEF